MKEAAATLVNRLVLLRHLEALGLSTPAIVTGGWSSRAYQQLGDFAPGLLTDETKGYAALLQVAFDELALDLPGLYGPVGLTPIFAVPPASLRELVAALDDPELASAWTDDTTLGWIYQYWNDPDREALDAKINAGGKIAPHEIASKTQMFTERYMVEWLLHNSLGLTWLCICKKNGWTSDAERVFPVLEARRAEWRKKREAGKVELDALMPTDGALEDAWKYYVLQPIPEDAVEKAPASIRELKLLDPACGSGHFLVIAFDLLARLYKEEARHTGKEFSDKEIAEAILENNLHGIDIDTRAIQIAAAGLYVKAKTLSRDARPKRMNLVAPALQLGNLPSDDPAVVHLREDLKREVGIPEALTNMLLTALAGVDYLGSLLKVEDAVKDALRDVDLEFERSHGQGDIFAGFPAQQVKLSIGEARATILDRLERFLAKHSTSEDLGLRLDGEQLAAGVRFVRIARARTFDVVVGNPPYHGTGKLEEAGYFVSEYAAGRADLFACFYMRGLELVRPNGLCAFITLSNWMTLGVYRDLRTLVREHGLVGLADLGKAAFTTGGTLISTTCAVLERDGGRSSSVALRPHSPNEIVRDDGQAARTEAGLILQRGRHDFNARSFAVIEGEPLLYGWSNDFLSRYAKAAKLGDTAPARKGLCTGDDSRFTRFWWEVSPKSLPILRCSQDGTPASGRWAPHIRGGKGRVWLEPLVDVIRYEAAGLEVRVFDQVSAGAAIRNPGFYFLPGVAFSMIGSAFSARMHRYRSVFGNKGSSVFTTETAQVACLMNSADSRFVLESLNPGIGFEVGDVNRLPVFPFEAANAVYAALDQAFTEHEAAREASVEFVRPGRSAWCSAQAWAQTAVDQQPGAPLPAYVPTYQAARASEFVSFELGVALGRFGGEGGADDSPRLSLPNGTLFVTCESSSDLDHPACLSIVAAWKKHRAGIGTENELGTWLRKSFFECHKKTYENRPIYFPISSKKKSFVAFISIHRCTDNTLSDLLAEHLKPTLNRLVGEQKDIRDARGAARDAKAEKRLAELGNLIEELSELVEKVTKVAYEGPPPIDANTAALWPLLEPQWKDPKKWWKELANAQGKKDYDWSHLAARYFPKRVRAKCVTDPSLAVAHKCFWELHPAKAYAWELRLQDEIRLDFTIDEPGSDEARARFLADHDRQAADLRAAEAKRRARKAAKADDAPEDGDGPLFDDDREETGEPADA